jgi:cobalt-zinc-cadmium efflux system membrane fusion protein
MDLSKVWVQIGVLEEDLHKVEVGQPVELRLTAYPGEVFKGKDFAVRVKGVYLDPLTHLGTVWAELTNPSGEPRILPGMHGEARLLLPSPKALPTVPGEAVVADGAERYVLVETTPDNAKESEYRRKNVVLGIRTPEGIQIVHGDVFVTDRVVTRGSHELSSFFVQGVLRLSPEAGRNIGLRVERVQRQVVEDVVEVDGGVDVLPDHRAAASSQLPGTLTRIRVERGQRVKVGDPLADIASLELQNMQLELLRAQLQLDLEEETLKRLSGADQVVARKQVWEAESHRNEARNRRDSLRRKLETLGLAPADVDGVLKDRKPVEAVPLRAPIDGVVVQFEKVLGQVIKAEEPLFQLHDLAHTWVQGYVSERDLSSVRIGQEARVRLVADPGFLARGKVVRSGQLFGTDDRTLSIWVELKEELAPRLPNGVVEDPAAGRDERTQRRHDVQDNMAARITLTVRRPGPTLAVPLSAVIREGTRAYVFVQTKEGGFERKPVDTGRADDQYVEILRGIESGETVAVSGAEGLQTAYASLR